MAHKDLFDPFTGREFVNHLQRVLNRSIQRWIAAEDDFPRGINGLAFVTVAQHPQMIVHFEWQCERVHFLMAAPAFFLAGDPHSLTQSRLGFFRQLGIDRDWNIRYGIAEQTFPNPTSARNRMVFHGVRVRDQPNGVCEDAQAFAGVHGGDGFQRIFSRRKNAIVEL